MRIRSLALCLLACLAVGIAPPAADLDSLSIRTSFNLVEAADPETDPVDVEGETPSRHPRIDRLVLTPDPLRLDRVFLPAFRIRSAVPVRAPPSA